MSLVENIIKKKNKLVRSKFTDNDMKILNTYFEKSNFPSKENKKELSLYLGKSERVIQVWFQNKRQRLDNKQDNKHVDRIQNRIQKEQEPNLIPKIKIELKLINKLNYSKFLSLHYLVSYKYLEFRLEILRNLYKKNKFPDITEITSIQFIINLNYNLVYLWFRLKNLIGVSNFKQDLNLLSCLYFILLRNK